MLLITRNLNTTNGDDMNNLTPDAPMVHQCFICGQSMDELSKASYVDVGIGQRLSGHDACLLALDEEISDRAAIAELTASALAAMETSPDMYALTEKIATQEAHKQIKKGLA
jgi:hypothetical protein